MAILHNPLFAIYASSALTTAFNIGLIVHQHKRCKRISLAIGYLGARFERIEAELEDIKRRLTALEEKGQRKLAA